MNDLEVFQLPVFDDNYIFILRDHSTKETVVIDPATSTPVKNFLASKNWKLTSIWNTHHHPDHVGGNLDLKQHTGCSIVCHRKDCSRIPGHDTLVGDGDQFQFGNRNVLVKDVSGHTLGHICYYIEEANLLFSGDTLFSMGCGRLFEGSPEQMWESLLWIRSLPDDTAVYCAHEYTLSNSDFAITIEPDNVELLARRKEVVKMREQGLSTVPTNLSLEKKTNPFLRADQPSVKSNLGLSDQPDSLVFAKIRQAKDQF